MTDPLFDPATGEVFEGDGGGDTPRPPTAPGADSCPRCESMGEELRQAREDLAGSEREVRSLRRRVGALEKEAEDRRRTAEERPVVVEVFEYWVQATGRNSGRTKLGEKREKALFKRVREGYDEDYLKQAVDGLVIGAYVNPESGKRYDDIELMARDETNVERFWQIAELAKTRPQQGAEELPPPEDPPWS